MAVVGGDAGWDFCLIELDGGEFGSPIDGSKLSSCTVRSTPYLLPSTLVCRDHPEAQCANWPSIVHCKSPRLTTRVEASQDH